MTRLSEGVLEVHQVKARRKGRKRPPLGLLVIAKLTLTFTFAPRPQQFLAIAHQFLQLLYAPRQQSLYHSAKIIANVTTAPHTTILNSIFTSDLRFLHLGVEFILFLWYNKVEIERRNAKLQHKKKDNTEDIC